jgi:Uma2 family endonuclease
MAKGGTLTYADLASFPTDNTRRELIDGDLIVSPSPKTRHQVISQRLMLELGKHIEAHGGGMVFSAPYDVVLSERDVVQPDLVFVADAQQQIVTEANVQGVPALLVEIVSDARVDRVRKRDLYARHDVAQYWIVDPDADRVEVYRHDGTGYPKPQILEPGDELTFVPLPGLRIDLARLLARPAGG